MGEDDILKVHMNWPDPDKAKAMKLFRQQCEIIFCQKKVKKEDQVDNILLRTGLKGL